MVETKRPCTAERSCRRRCSHPQAEIEGTGMQWQKVADNMSVMGQDIPTRAVRDHYKMISKIYRARMAREERATGEGGAELTEDEMLLEELIDVEDETDRQMEYETEAKNQRIENERGQALEMRERAMEGIGQTRKRMGGTSESDGTVQKRRRSGEMKEWLQERIELEKEEKEVKQTEKREHMEAQRIQHLEILQVMQ